MYDGLDNLRYVLQPMYQTNANLNMYAFQYKYMGRQLCIEKKMPGAEAIKYVYDKLDRLIFSQDGNQRLQNEWTFYLYDRLNRLTVQGICMEIDRLNLIPDVAVTCYRENSNTGLGGSGYYSTFIPIDKVKEIHIVNYYDDYKFCSLTGFSGVPHFSMGSNAKGYLTGNVVTILEDGKKLYSANYYDVKGRITKKVSSNHMNEYEVDNITYSFTDKPLTASHTHTAINATELYTYVYDHAERLQEVRHKLNGNSEVKLAINTYDKLGRLKTKTHHGTSGHKLTYEYNIRNWLTQISGRLFEQNLYYNTGSGSQCYNGNIGSMTWKSGEDGIRGYKFTYDNMSRMRNAIYGEGTSITPPTGKNFSENVIGYDYNGNITGLQRYGKVSGSTYGKIDDLSITYVGNQLNNVTDAATDPLYNGAFNFVDGNKTSIQEYKYDASGNLEQDYNKKIAKIQYNSLNLPSTLQFANGNSTNYLYGADGMKRRVTHKTAIANISVPMGQIKELANSQISQINTTDYCSNVIYENGVLSMILTEEGYVTLSGDAPIYHYYLKDHQGNNRIVMNQNGTTVEQVNHYYPFGGLFEESLATSDQNYKYNSKELDRMHGLDWYDYEARHYDTALGRFTVMDPLAEKYYFASPYTYCMNNPVKYIDPTGKEVWIYYQDDNGEQQQMLYNANMNYSGNNNFVSNSINYLNIMYNNGGDVILDVLINSKNTFNIKNEIPIDKEGNPIDALSFNESEFGGGDIYAGMVLNSNVSKYKKIESVSHELFHGFQYEKGQGGASIFNEVEANVYSSIITTNWLNSTDYCGPLSANGLGNETAKGTLYQQSFDSLTKSFTNDAFHNAVRTFKSGSMNNASGLYNNYPIIRNQKKYLLKLYYPR